MHCETTRKILEPWAIAFLRIAVGIIMVAHGWGKLQDPAAFQGVLGQIGFPFPVIGSYLAIAGEFGGGLGLILGLLTPIAAMGVFFTMLVAIIFVHLPNGLMMQNQGFEYPLALLAVSVFFIIRGAGPISLDALCCKKT